MKHAIEISSLCKKFKKTVAVDDLSLTVPEGSVTAFLGPNGAGKTTTIKCLLNLVQPTSGESKVLGCPSSRLGPEIFAQTAYVSENQELPLWMSVREFLDFCRPLYPGWDREFEKKMLRDFDLPSGTKLRALSRGMRMKASLLSSLAYRPKLVILDEPFSGLDPLVRDEFIRGLLELTEEEGWSVFISSHDIDEVQRLCDRVVIINRGQLHLDETTEALLGRFRSIEVFLKEDSDLPNPVPEGWMGLEKSGRVIRFRHSNFNQTTLNEELTRALGTLGEVQVHAMNLREIFITLSRNYRLNA